jgi:uncharacterized membrane protein
LFVTRSASSFSAFTGTTTTTCSGDQARQWASFSANLHLLFWLSLIPFVTAWMGRRFRPAPVALYGVVLLLAAIAYHPHPHPGFPARYGLVLATAVGAIKGKISLLIYLVAIALAFVSIEAACALYVVVAVIWLVPDRRIERTLAR